MESWTTKTPADFDRTCMSDAVKAKSCAVTVQIKSVTFISERFLYVAAHLSKQTNEHYHYVDPG